MPKGVYNRQKSTKSAYQKIKQKKQKHTQMLGYLMRPGLVFAIETLQEKLAEFDRVSSDALVHSLHNIVGSNHTEEEEEEVTTTGASATNTCPMCGKVCKGDVGYAVHYRMKHTKKGKAAMLLQQQKTAQTRLNNKREASA